MRLKLLAVVASLLCLTLLTPRQTAWAQETLEVNVSSTNIAPGDTITVSGEGCGAGEGVTIAANVQIDGIIVESTADESGAFSEEITLVAEAVEDLDRFGLVVSCPDSEGNQQTVSIVIEVEHEDEEGELPFTGRDVLPLLVLASGLLVAGLVLIRARTRIRFD